MREVKRGKSKCHTVIWKIYLIWQKHEPPTQYFLVQQIRTIYFFSLKNVTHAGNLSAYFATQPEPPVFFFFLAKCYQCSLYMSETVYWPDNFSQQEFQVLKKNEVRSCGTSGRRLNQTNGLHFFFCVTCSTSSKKQTHHPDLCTKQGREANKLLHRDGSRLRHKRAPGQAVR